MNSYFEPDYYGDDVEPGYADDYTHNDQIPDLSECALALKEVLQSIYGDIDIDVKSLNAQLHFLADELNVDIPEGIPTVQRRVSIAQQRRKSILDYQMGYTRAYAEINTQKKAQ